MIRMTSNDYYDFLEKVLERYEELSEKVYFIGEIISVPLKWDELNN